MQKELIILDEDKAWARTRIAELDAEIQALGPEFYDVFNQSSETWHDNAPFDALRDRQSVLDAERQQLKLILRDSLPRVPRQWPDRIGIGSTVTVRDERGGRRTYFIAGDWTAFAGQEREGCIIVSCKTLLAQELLGRKAHEQITVFNKKLLVGSFEVMH